MYFSLFYRYIIFLFSRYILNNCLEKLKKY